MGDVECFWKKRQRQLIKEIPIPRFTQQDIIDKRSYIPASGARQAKARRSKLFKRSLSISAQIQPKLTRSTDNQPQQNSKKVRRKSHPPSQEHYTEEDGNDSSGSSSSCEFLLPHQLSSQQHQNQTYFFHHYEKQDWATKANSTLSPTLNNRNHSVSSFDASCVPSDLNGEPSVVKNSLDFLSYAIAMTEKKQENQQEPSHHYHHQRQNSDYLMEAPTLLEDDDEEDEDTDLNLRDDVSPDWTRTSQLRLSLSIPNQLVEDDSNTLSSVSATNAAARAMMMFVNREQN